MQGTEESLERLRNHALAASRFPVSFHLNDARTVVAMKAEAHRRELNISQYLRSLVVADLAACGALDEVTRDHPDYVAGTETG